jgi:hypothetical protein
MTFKVVSTSENNERKVLGTVWATEETQANVLATAVWGTGSDRKVTIRKADEESEIPLLIPN